MVRDYCMRRTVKLWNSVYMHKQLCKKKEKKKKYFSILV